MHRCEQAGILFVQLLREGESDAVCNQDVMLFGFQDCESTSSCQFRQIESIFPGMSSHIAVVSWVLPG